MAHTRDAAVLVGRLDQSKSSKRARRACAGCTEAQHHRNRPFADLQPGQWG